jgi:hypothetical protein
MVENNGCLLQQLHVTRDYTVWAQCKSLVSCAICHYCTAQLQLRTHQRDGSGSLDIWTALEGGHGNPEGAPYVAP